MYLADHIVFILLGFVLPLLLFMTTRRQARSGKGMNWSAALKIRLYYGNGLLLCGLALMVLIIWYFSGRPFTALGLGWGEMPYDTVANGILFAFLFLYGVDLYAELGSQERRNETKEKFDKMGFLPTTGTQYLHFLFLALAAGVCEEIVYRGFMISYLAEVLGNSAPAIVATLLLPAISFGMGHFYQGGRAVVKVIAMALLFGFFFLRTGTLWPLMLLHTAIDAVGGLLSWYLEERKRL